MHTDLMIRMCFILRAAESICCSIDFICYMVGRWCSRWVGQASWSERRNSHSMVKSSIGMRNNHGESHK